MLTVGSHNPLESLKLSHGAYTQLEDLLKLRHAVRQLKLNNHNKTSNPLAGILSSKYRGRGIDFAEVRHYEPGDDVRTIDWKVTARTQVPHTKLFQEEKERPVLILLDQSQSMFFGSKHNFKSVLAAQLSALLAWLSLDQGDRVGGIVFSDKAHREVRPRRSKHSVLQLLHQVDEFNHRLNREQTPIARPYLTEALLSARRVAKHGSSIFIISDFLNFDEDSQLHLRRLAQHNDVFAFHISDALEQHLPQPDVYQVTNGQERMQINTVGKQNRQQYANLFQARLGKIHTEFEKLKAPFIPLSSDDDPVQAIMALARLTA